MKNITREQLEELYINKNKTMTQTAEILNIDQSTVSKLIKKYNLDKPYEMKLESKRAACRDKYGVNNIMQLEEKKNKLRNTLLDRYGNYYPLERAKRIRETIISKYGSEGILNNPEAKEKYKQTCLAKYGVEHPTQSNIVKDKISKSIKERNKKRIENTLTKDFLFDNYIIKNKTIKQISDTYHINKTILLDKLNEYDIHKDSIILNEERIKFLEDSNLKKYGPKNITAFTKFLDIDIESEMIINDKTKFIEFVINNKGKTIQELAAMLKSSYSNIYFKINLYGLDNYVKKTTWTSKYIKEIADYIKSLGIDYNDNGAIDLYLPEYNIGINFNDSYCHSEEFKPNDYHQLRSLYYKERGIFVYDIYEYDWVNDNKREIIKNDLKHLLKKDECYINSDDCQLIEIDNGVKNMFLNKYHIKGKDKSTIKIGLMYKNELVSIMTFVKARLNNRYNWELSRYCTKDNLYIKNGYKKMFDYFVDNYLLEADTILYYLGIGIERPDILEELSFQYSHTTKPNYIWWYNNDIILSPNQCKNEARKNNYIKIFNSGNEVWAFKKIK